MISQTQQKYYTPEEYLELEVNSTDRHEYIHGEIVQMTGGLPNHNKVVLNLSATLLFQLKRQPYEVYVTDQRLWIPKHQMYTYPDVMVFSQPIDYAEGRRDTLINPVLLAEVLSPSTRNYDRGDQFTAYRSIPTFEEYLLVDPLQIHVEHYFKTASQRWIFAEYDNSETVIPLQSIGCEIAIADLYDKVDFNPQEDASTDR